MVHAAPVLDLERPATAAPESALSSAAPELALDPTAPAPGTPELALDPTAPGTPELAPLGTAGLPPELELGAPAGPAPDLGAPPPELDLGMGAAQLGPATTPELDVTPAGTPELNVTSAGTPELDVAVAPEATPELDAPSPTSDFAPGASPELSAPDLDLGGAAPTPELDLSGPASTPELELAAPVANQVASAAGDVDQPRAPVASLTPASQPGPAPGARSTPAPASARATPASVRVSGMVVVSSQTSGEHPWRLYAAIGGTALAAILVVVIVSVITSRPPPPPEMPNPLRARVAEWVAAGATAEPATVEAAVRAASAGVEQGTDAGMRAARAAARSALIVDVDSPAAIAAYGHVLALWPDRVDRDDLDEALGAITSAVGEDPNGVHRADLEDARAWLHLRNGKVEAARQAAARVLELAPTPNAQVTHAVARLRTRAAEAAVELQAVVDGGEAPVNATLWLGEAYLRSGDIARALRVWRTGSSGRPQDIGIMRRLARLSADTGELSDAKLRLEEIVDHGWASAEDRLLLARLYARADKDAARALEQLDAGLTDTALSPLNRARLMCEKAAVVAVSRGAKPSSREVSAWLDAAFELAPDLPELLYVAGIIDDSTGSTDNAIDSLEAATDVAPEHPEAAVPLALLLREVAPADARQVIDNAIEETPHYVPLHLVRAILELDAGNKTAAASAIRRALDYDPARTLVSPRLDAFFEPKQAHQRIGKLLAQRSRGVDNPMLITASGVAYYFAGDLGKANSTLNKAVRADAREVGARLYRALVALRRNKKGPAKRDLAAASDADRQHLVVRYYQARVAELGRKTKGDAERIYRDLLDANPLDAAARVGLARTLQARGAREEARAEVLKVLTARPRDRAALSFLVSSVRRTGGKKRRR